MHLILKKSIKSILLGYIKAKTIKEDKLRVNLKYLAYYILLQMAYINNIYGIYLVPKKNTRSILLKYIGAKIIKSIKI